MRVIATELPEVKLVSNEIHNDDRGFFREAFNASELANCGVVFDCVQINHSCSTQVGTIRGLHFQSPPMASSKLVRVIAGAILRASLGRAQKRLPPRPAGVAQCVPRLRRRTGRGFAPTG